MHLRRGAQTRSLNTRRSIVSGPHNKFNVSAACEFDIIGTLQRCVRS